MNQRDIKGDRMYDETSFPESSLTLATKNAKKIILVNFLMKKVHYFQEY